MSDQKMADKQRKAERHALAALARDVSSSDDCERMGKELAMLGACMIDNAHGSGDEVYLAVRKALGFEDESSPRGRTIPWIEGDVTRELDGFRVGDLVRNSAALTVSWGAVTHVDRFVEVTYPGCDVSTAYASSQLTRKPVKEGDIVRVLGTSLRGQVTAFECESTMSPMVRIAGLKGAYSIARVVAVALVAAPLLKKGISHEV
jgi:hypothetical protein